ncbi:hypothetical protein [Streptomyces sp. YGL11-2]|uniref:hypothetical protein n=1 Tax=Streptomyces sp. YGL11-2 TaxID=3414028 RepID=UPI003CF6F49B
MGRLNGDVRAVIEKDAAERAESEEAGDAFYERLKTLEQEGDQEGQLRLRAEQARPAGRVGEFVHSLNVNAARRIIDWSFDDLADMEKGLANSSPEAIRTAPRGPRPAPRSSPTTGSALEAGARSAPPRRRAAQSPSPFSAAAW